VPGSGQPEGRVVVGLRQPEPAVLLVDLHAEGAELLEARDDLVGDLGLTLDPLRVDVVDQEAAQVGQEAFTAFDRSRRRLGLGLGIEQIELVVAPEQLFAERGLGPFGLPSGLGNLTCCSFAHRRHGTSSDGRGAPTPTYSVSRRQRHYAPRPGGRLKLGGHPTGRDETRAAEHDAVVHGWWVETPGPITGSPLQFGERPDPHLPTQSSVNTAMFEPPLPLQQAGRVELVKGPNISALPDFGPLPDRIEAPVALKVGDDVSTDEILPAGARVLPYRSNIPKLADFTFTQLDESYPRRVIASKDGSGHIVVAGANYGQGSSREHAAIAPRYLGLRAVLALSFARIHWQNLANFGVLALEFTDPDDHRRIEQDDVLVMAGIRNAIRSGTEVKVRNATRDQEYTARHRLSGRQVAMLLAGGLLPWLRQQKEKPTT